MVSAELVGNAVAGLIYVELALAVIIPAIYVAAPGLARYVQALTGVAVLAFLIASAATVYYVFSYGNLTTANNMIVHDKLSSVMLLGAAIAAALAYIQAYYKAEEWPTHPGYYGLLPLTLFGTFFLMGSLSPLLILASWLVLSVATYIITGLPGDRNSVAAAVRYIYVGTLATLFMAAWIAAFYAGLRPPLALEALAIVAIMASIGFKLGAFPFHWWVPNVYGRADGRAIAIVAGVAKLAFLGLLVRLVYTLSGGLTPFEADALALLLAASAVVTMTLGNLSALNTGDLRAMLAYSSIAQTGYLLVGMVAVANLVSAGVNPTIALAGIGLQAVAYAVAKAPLFSLAAETEGRVKGILKGDWASAVSVAILLASLLGVPPLIGFWGKLYMFLPATSYSSILVLIALVNSGVSSVYYIRFLRDAFDEADEAPSITEESRYVLVLAALVTLLLGLAAPLVVNSFF
ncbi:NADH-quinone oxidoreductase subunit NuoN [Aeropyrum camini]|uniref:NADH dehydrogenase subunit N n=1 Tax=Aeropyrum camini SY1 = JCM 12091 TaxID=1198449 RepID=U3T9Z7_9CREN|nr:NADH-quinone oxidoreductase subunit NuoN [Aeropyrum camini]BAN90357.1 NADH dehydrogenase subunit N [Aeropyrum camini SY1 = JCM 12091]